MSELPRLWLVRHGETEWSRSGQYTGLTDLPLTPHGEEQARVAGAKLTSIQQAGTSFDLVMTSPSQRAWHTAELAGFPGAEVVDYAHEWDYGDYEGVRSAEVRERNPSYLIWDDGVPAGETIEQVGVRAERIVQRVRSELADGGNAVLFSHGHFSRILAATWLGLGAGQGRHFLLGTAEVCRLGWDKKTPAVEAWGL
ncbi:MAG: histidine phosphatase family protein [Arthrobacter sp.]|uniref:histidine phosphatase family protein n=1 Tax=unclassified Arthrobacter TaxID=235627 RepID=UPI00264E8152|nr:histidine phosphatase family protein [Micrococcaceae bacterium]MDN5813494.1 histidine phosphatase family protein [Micrococcaceae bacterium]MDN5824960.1 histidine phosphatase family protein [Micrococcaceae bacterium]MDN5880236.1 histidine phosphatase family protein [Micrococcaceae bacterium]MDN5887744.1 histidine phosphatase family protein [Micrococcaceae bacterium]